MQLECAQALHEAVAESPTGHARIPIARCLGGIEYPAWQSVKQIVHKEQVKSRRRQSQIAWVHWG